MAKKNKIKITRGGIKFGGVADVFKSPDMGASLNSSTFNLNHDHKTSTHFGRIQPVDIQLVEPGDQFNVSIVYNSDWLPIAVPIKHAVGIRFDAFFCPFPQLWQGWTKFQTGSKGGSYKTPVPSITLDPANPKHRALFGTRSLLSFMGLSPQSWINNAEPVTISALPARMYDLICRYFYADQDLTEEVRQDLPGAVGYPMIVGFDCIDGSPFREFNDVSWGEADEGGIHPGEADTILRLWNSCWEVDLFQYCRPTTQLGEDVFIPTGVDFEKEGLMKIYDPDGHLSSSFTGLGVVGEDGGNNTLKIVGLDGESTSNAEIRFGTMLDLERHKRLQAFLMRNQRAGYGYYSQMIARYGETLPLEMVDKPIYLGSVTGDVSVDTLYQSVATDSAPLGELGGRAKSVGSGFLYNARFNQHGYVMVLMRVLPKVAYVHNSQSLWYKLSSILDYYTPEFDGVGEMAIPFNMVEFGRGEGVFGFVPNYMDYRCRESEVTGDMRVDKFWHMARETMNISLLGLNDDFITANPLEDEELNRPFAVDPTSADRDPILIHVYFKVRARRKMSYFGEYMTRMMRKGM